MKSLRSSSTAGLLAYSKSSAILQTKKSIGVRSGDRGGQTRQEEIIGHEALTKIRRQDYRM